MSELNHYGTGQLSKSRQRKNKKAKQTKNDATLTTSDTTKLNILLIPGGGSQPSIQQANLWKKFIGKMGHNAEVALFQSNKAKKPKKHKKNKKRPREEEPQITTFSICISSFRDNTKTIKELQRLHIQIDNRSFVDGKAWWNHVLQTKAITVEQSQQFLLVDAPPATTVKYNPPTANNKSSSSSSSSSSTSNIPSFTNQTLANNIIIPNTPALQKPLHISSYNVDPQAQKILDNALNLYNRKGNVHMMLNFPASWYIHFPKFNCLSVSEFQNAWVEITDLSPATKHTDRGSRQSSDEKHYKMFKTRSGKGNYMYSGISNEAQLIKQDDPADLLLNMCNALMNDAPSHACIYTRPEKKCPTHTIPPNAFNAVLKNWYTPENYIMAHQDDESQHVVGAPIFSFSAGGTRTFRLALGKDQTTGKPIAIPNTRGQQGASRLGAFNQHEIELQDGDLIVMGGHLNRTHRHDIKQLKEGETSTNRINWTCRAFDEKYVNA